MEQPRNTDPFSINENNFLSVKQNLECQENSMRALQIKKRYRETYETFVCSTIFVSSKNQEM